ncbi:hypothetical protein Hanom_Chr06g00517841 [Helianthus anomalus]
MYCPHPSQVFTESVASEGVHTNLFPSTLSRTITLNYYYYITIHIDRMKNSTLFFFLLLCPNPMFHTGIPIQTLTL